LLGIDVVFDVDLAIVIVMFDQHIELRIGIHCVNFVDTKFGIVGGVVILGFQEFQNGITRFVYGLDTGAG